MHGMARTAPSRNATARPSPRTRPAVGPQIRRWRRERGKTLAQIAATSGLNVGYLSQVENDKASPSLETLASLAGALDVPITWLLVDASAPPRVVRVKERRQQRGPGGVRVEHVDGGIPRDLRIVSATMAPGRRSGLHAHSGDEHHIVLSGRARLTQGTHWFDLGPGDYLLWDASVPHDAEALGEEPATILIISHSPHEAQRREGAGGRPA